jgi:SPP1 family phage portal protein
VERGYSVLGCFGRKKIFTDVTEITRDNVLEVLRKALITHWSNKADVEYLYAYYKGRQPVLNRKKEVRPEIKNTVVENRANEIVSFKVGYLMGEPIQYVSRSDDKMVADRITTLNGYCLSEDKAAKDKELADWFHICGTAYRMVLPDSVFEKESDEAPFEIYTLDPRFTFVVYANSIGEPPVMGVKYIKRSDGAVIYSIYTKDRYFEVENQSMIVREEAQPLGIPIIEYPANNARLGAFEIVLPLLDAINTVDSNRLDGVEQFVQALMLFHNVDISSDDFSKLRDEGAIKFKDIDPQYKAEIEYLTSELNQSQTQALVDHLYNTVLTICGMPNRNGGTSTSDTGSAVIMRDGWSAAEARAKDSELMFKLSEKEFLKLVLRICSDLSDLKLKLSNVEVRFTRRNYENIAQKATVLTTMLSNPKIAPVLAFTHSGMFSDPQLAYRMSMDYAEEQEKKAAELAAKPKEVNPDGEGNPPDPGSGQKD